VAAHVNRAGVSWRVGDFEGALAHARAAVELAPRHPCAQRILGTALLQLNRLHEAETHLRRALQLQPDFVLAQLDLALVLLLAGRLQEAWPLWQQRWRDPRLLRPDSFRPEREWPGPSVSVQGRSIAVHGEQGRGDVLQCLRYLPRLQALGARVACVLPQEIVPLVAASFPEVECLPAGGAWQADFHVALMDLPGRFGTTLDSIPARVPYLQVPQDARARWRARLAPWSRQRKVGLAWCGSQAQVNNRNRALPLGLLLPPARTPGVQCFSLQKEDAGGWSDVAPAAGELMDLTGDWHDFVESAAMIEALDLVITVDTAIAHLAGALGKPVWIVLAPNADWRWLLEREDSPWYPTARLFRRGHGEGREAQVERVRAAFVEWCA
jgi:hypothetical protein